MDEALTAGISEEKIQEEKPSVLAKIKAYDEEAKIRKTLQIPERQKSGKRVRTEEIL